MTKMLKTLLICALAWAASGQRNEEEPWKPTTVEEGKSWGTEDCRSLAANQTWAGVVECQKCAVSQCLFGCLGHMKDVDGARECYDDEEAEVHAAIDELHLCYRQEARSGSCLRMDYVEVGMTMAMPNSDTRWEDRPRGGPPGPYPGRPGPPRPRPSPGYVNGSAYSSNGPSQGDGRRGRKRRQAMVTRRGGAEGPDRRGGMGGEGEERAKPPGALLSARDVSRTVDCMQECWHGQRKGAGLCLSGCPRGTTAQKHPVTKCANGRKGQRLLKSALQGAACFGKLLFRRASTWLGLFEKFYRDLELRQ